MINKSNPVLPFCISGFKLSTIFVAGKQSEIRKHKINKWNYFVIYQRTLRKQCQLLILSCNDTVLANKHTNKHTYIKSITFKLFIPHTIPQIFTRKLDLR